MTTTTNQAPDANSTYRYPAQNTGDSFTGPVSQSSEQPTPRSSELTPDLLRSDREAHIAEATFLAMSAFEREGSTPLFHKTAELLGDRERMKLRPEVEEFRRIFQSLGIMQDKYMDETFDNPALLVQLVNMFGKRRVSEVDREEFRKRLIDEETSLSPKIFAEVPENQKPKHHVWEMHHIDGHVFWTMYDPSVSKEPLSTIHYTPTYDGATKTQSFLNDSRLIHEVVEDTELKTVVYYLSKLESLVANELYLKPQNGRRGRHS
ncbi:MAG: hypothetical protein ABIP50_01980 [Candidatus Saccharimonadales bacterium]